VLQFHVVICDIAMDELASLLRLVLDFNPNQYRLAAMPPPSPRFLTLVKSMGG
jgi:hypothetical protein